MTSRDTEGAIESALQQRSAIDFADELMELIDWDTEEQYLELGPVSRTAVIVNLMSLEQNSGGFYQVLVNLEQPRVDHLLAALEAIGATNALSALQRVIARLPTEVLESDEVTKGEALDRANEDDRLLRRVDREYAASGEDVIELLRTYVRKHFGELERELHRAVNAP